MIKQCSLWEPSEIQGLKDELREGTDLFVPVTKVKAKRWVTQTKILSTDDMFIDVENPKGSTKSANRNTKYIWQIHRTQGHYQNQFHFYIQA